MENEVPMSDIISVDLMCSESPDLVHWISYLAHPDFIDFYELSWMAIFALETGLQFVTMIVSGGVRFQFRESIQKRLVKLRIARDITI
jgi:hypothetical protein